MRVSTYEIILPMVGADEQPITGKRLLINGLYGAVDAVDEETAQALRGGSLASLPVAVRERLASRGHITHKRPEAEAEDVQLLGRIYHKTLGRSDVSLVMLPTYDCNFRCPYCFEKHRLERGSEWLCRGITPGMVEAVFAALRKQREKGYRVESCALYGGEPLMKQNRAIVRDICAHAWQMDLKLSAITNGYDLDAYLDLLEEFRFDYLQITVDGVGPVNDRRRLHKDGVPTYGRIMENIRLALERGIRIQLRVNVNRENIGGIPELIRDLSARGLTGASEGEGGNFAYYSRRYRRRTQESAPVSQGFYHHSFSYKRPCRRCRHVFF